MSHGAQQKGKDQVSAPVTALSIATLLCVGSYEKRMTTRYVEALPPPQGHVQKHIKLL
jgi:hypothetical protein